MQRTLPRSWHPALVGLIALGMFGLASCGSRGPKTYPVKGKVVSEKGGDVKPLVGKGIELQSTTEPDRRAFGIIQSDGSFTVSTMIPGESASLPGAIAGTHKARLQIAMAEDDDGQSRRKSPIDSKYGRFETSGWEITVPTTGEVVLKVR